MTLTEPHSVTTDIPSPAKRQKLSGGDEENRAPSTATIEVQIPVSSMSRSTPPVQQPLGQAKLPVVKLSKEEEKARREQEKLERERERLQREQEKEREKAKREAEKETERKRKEAERAAKEAEKEKKEQEKAAKKAELAAKKAAKEEEKKKKDAEKEAEKAAKEEEKRKKEEEKAKKEEERLKKERAQKRLDFFVTAKKKPEPAPTIAIEKAAEKTDFDKEFLPFEIKPHMVIAPRPFERDEAARAVSKRKLDEYLSSQNTDTEMTDADSNDLIRVRETILDLLNLPPYKRQRLYVGELPKHTTKEVIIRLSNEEATIPLNAPTSAYTVRNDCLKELNSIPRKVILQHTGLRPAYIGTFTKAPASSGLRKGRNPFQKTLPNINYDYDSEEEWGIGMDEEGEDILSGDEEDEDSGSDEEMNEFLDDEEDSLAKAPRKKILVELEPVCTALCFEEDGVNPNAELRAMRIEPLIDIDGPIDPFKDYWSKKSAPTTAKPMSSTVTFLSPNTAKTPKAAKPANTMAPPAKPPAKPKTLVPADQMDAFKAAIVQNSNEAKAGLINNLKIAFPALSKETIRDTVAVVAARISSNGVKQWRLLAD